MEVYIWIFTKVEDEFAYICELKNGKTMEDKLLLNSEPVFHFKSYNCQGVWNT